MSDLIASRGTTKICLGCRLIVPTNKDGLIPSEVQCACSPEGRRTTWMFGDFFAHAIGCRCTCCVEKCEWRLAEWREGIADAVADRPSSEVNVWYLDGYVSFKFCSSCRRPLDVPGDPSSGNCGGDCVQCMAEAGDLDCIRSMAELNKEHL